MTSRVCCRSHICTYCKVSPSQCEKLICTVLRRVSIYFITIWQPIVRFKPIVMVQFVCYIHVFTQTAFQIHTNHYAICPIGSISTLWHDPHTSKAHLHLYGAIRWCCKLRNRIDWMSRALSCVSDRTKFYSILNMGSQRCAERLLCVWT